MTGERGPHVTLCIWMGSDLYTPPRKLGVAYYTSTDTSSGAVRPITVTHPRSQRRKLPEQPKHNENYVPSTYQTMIMTKL